VSTPLFFVGLDSHVIVYLHGEDLISFTTSRKGGQQIINLMLLQAGGSVSVLLFFDLQAVAV